MVPRSLLLMVLVRRLRLQKVSQTLVLRVLVTKLKFQTEPNI